MIPAPAFSGSAFAFSRPLFWRSAFSRSAVYGLRFRGLCFRDAQQKPATFVYRAGTKSEDGPSFDLKDKSIDEGNFCLFTFLTFSTVSFMHSRNQRLVKCV